MKKLNVNLVAIVFALANTFILYIGITKDFSGVINLGCNSEGCTARIEKTGK